jgi:hypothetical protein
VRVLDKEGASPRAKGFFYKTIVQSVLLYGCETWTVTGSMLCVLSSFHHRVARRITNMMPRKTHGEWHYPPLDKALREAGLHSMEHYIAVRHNRMARLFAERPIYTQCLADVALLRTYPDTRNNNGRRTHRKTKIRTLIRTPAIAMIRI